MSSDKLGFCCLLIFTLSITKTLGESHYSIVAPGTIRSNRNYSIGLSNLEGGCDATFRVTIRSLSSSMKLSQDVLVFPKYTKLIHFMIPRLYSQFKYELKIEGLEGVKINESKELLVIEKGGPRIYVESDKAFYKPEDVVQFRVIILNEHLKLTQIDEPMRVQILDPQNNRIKQFKDIQLTRGVFTGKFNISKQPILGKWTIDVFIGGKYDMHQQYTFKVEKYVLPKFSVHIENERNMVGKDRIFPITVYGKYTHGKYVQGTVDIVLYDFMRYVADKKTVIIDSRNLKANVMLNIGDMDYSWKFYIEATLREKDTNVSATGESEIFNKQQRYSLTVPRSGYKFKNGKPYQLELHVQHWNNTPVVDRASPVTMRINDVYYGEYMDDKGVVKFKFRYEEGVRYFGFTYKGSTLLEDNPFHDTASYMVANTNCHLVLKAQRSADLSEPLEIEVSSNTTIPYFCYTLTSHGNILQQEYVYVGQNRKSHTLKIKASIDMVPQSYMFVHYVVDDQLHYCELTLSLPSEFENQVDISGPTRVKPGQEITMNIKAQPNSRVSILAVDKSVLLLGSDNVLRKDAIMDDLRHDRASQSQHNEHDREYTYYPGYTSGLIIFTSAKYKEYTYYAPMRPWASNAPSKVRTLFPETWIFQDIDIDKPNTALKLQVPDTITTWIVRAFSVNDETGLGLMEQTLDIEAYKPFFISLNLPYAVKRGEVVSIHVTIFNYLNDNLDTVVKMTNDNQDFSFVDQQNKPLANQQDNTKNINIPPNGGKSVSFEIMPKKVGKVDVHISAKNSITSDELVEKLRVEPEGIAHNFNSDKFLDVLKGQSEKMDFQADIPGNIVTESEYLVLTVSGDIMGSTLDNLENLVLKPTGCGEQNMINLAPNILILDYLKASNKSTTQTDLVDRAKNFIEVGYQQELTYRHPSGGYSPFGPTKPSKVESNWLTAYVTRFFIKAMPYSAIETNIIESGLDYLKGQQLDNGGFPQRGYLFDPAHQNEYGFTAFVLLTFLENKNYSQTYNDVIDKGLNFLNINYNSVQDIYSLAIMANVYQRAGNSVKANDTLKKINSLAKEENGLKWWTNNMKSASANDVEITSYVLMALLETPGQYQSIFNWLLQQRNSQGGFFSTHDTVVGLQALAKYAEKSSQTEDEAFQVKVHYVAKDRRGGIIKDHSMEVDKSNSMILQKQELPPTTRSVNVDVTGQGRVYLQFSYQYYTSPKPRRFHNRWQPGAMSSQPSTDSLVHEYFSLKPTATMSTTTVMTLDICFAYRPLTEEERLTNMITLEIQLPSGFTSNSDQIERLREEENISRVDSENSATKLAIYFEKLEANDEQCVTINADKGHDVGLLKPSSIEMRDYYNRERRSIVLYELK